MIWISPSDELPRFGQVVLCYYTIGEHEYYVTGRVESITITNDIDGTTRNVEWLESTGFNSIIEPKLWTPITGPKGH